MTLMQITRKPVKVYRSTDDNAPQLTATAGSLKILLKACLVSGYGSTAPLGWEMPFENGDIAAFKSKDPTSTGCYLKVENKSARYAELYGYQTMSALETGEGRFTISRFPYLYSTTNQTDWLLVGHDKAFWLFLKNTYTNYESSVWLYFGDFPSYAPADTGNCLIAHDSYSQNYNYLYSSTSFLPSLDSNNYYIRAAKSANQLNTNAAIRTNSRCRQYWGVQYPDPITGGLQADAIDLHEYLSNDQKAVLRGRLPGLYVCAHNLNSINEYATISGFDGTDDKFAKLTLRADGSAAGYALVNLTAWEA